MPLFIAPLDRDLRIIKMLVDGKTKKHLESLGITLDSKIRVISNCHGNLICLVKDGRLAIDQEISGRIIVDLLESEKSEDGETFKRFRRRRNRDCQKGRGRWQNPPSTF
ncbi:MAG: ferrous iron transport protein A [Bacilli bacterium]|jgi:Fe2+ transport system protein FeoA